MDGLQYEGSENFAALTSFGVVPAYEGLTRLISGKVPGLEIDLSKESLQYVPNFGIFATELSKNEQLKFTIYVNNIF